MGLDIGYLCTKFDYCSLCHSGEMVHAHQNLNGSRDLTTPLSGASTCNNQPGVVCMVLGFAVLVQHRRVTDGQTNGCTDTRRQHIPCYHSVMW